MKIVIQEGIQKGKIFHIDPPAECIIGRDKKCDICLRDNKSSRHHARIHFEQETPVLEDMGSTNGTKLNGKPVFKILLHDNDEIQIGDTLLKISGLNETSPQDTSVQINEEGASTLIVSTLPHLEADLLSGRESLSREINDLLQENALLKKITEISQMISQKKAPNGLIHSILELMQKTLKADNACLLVWSEKNKEWIIRSLSGSAQASKAVKISQTIIRQALNEGVTILSSDPLTDNRFDPSLSIISEGISSALCSPILIEQQFKAILFIDRRKKKEVFSSLDMRFAATIANLLGLYLENEALEADSRKNARLAVIGEVIAGLAHHTKNIIAGLRFTINALEISLEKRNYETMKKCLHSVSLQERKISDLVLNMLTYSKDRIPERQNVSLKKIILETCDPYLGFMAEKEIRFDLTAPENSFFFGDEILLGRLFLNLLVNAMDSFRYKKNPGIKEIHIRIEKENAENGYRIRFRDTGCGISKENLKRMFTVFYSTKGSEGTGLGLAVVQKIVEEHSGTITVDSREGEWTEFTITLPPFDPAPQNQLKN